MSSSDQLIPYLHTHAVYPDQPDWPTQTLTIPADAPFTLYLAHERLPAPTPALLRVDEVREADVLVFVSHSCVSLDISYGFSWFGFGFDTL